MSIRIRDQFASGRRGGAQQDSSPLERVGQTTERQRRLPGVGCRGDRSQWRRRGELCGAGLNVTSTCGPISSATSARQRKRSSGSIGWWIVTRTLARRIGQFVNSLVVFVLEGYQQLVSPFFAAMGSQCRFEPSCSQYMIDAVRSRGALVGVGMGIWRLARCNPFNQGGYDPALPSQDVSRETI